MGGFLLTKDANMGGFDFNFEALEWDFPDLGGFDFEALGSWELDPVEIEAWTADLDLGSWDALEVG